MRAAWLVLLVCTTCSFSQDAARYGVALDAKAYPQATPKDALSSVLKAIEAKNYNYLVAQLADPSFVDARVKGVFGGRFADQAEDTKARLDPATVKLLQRFAKEGTWTVGKVSAVVGLDDAKERVVRLVKAGDRWYLSHDSTPEK